MKFERSIERLQLVRRTVNPLIISISVLRIVVGIIRKEERPHDGLRRHILSILRPHGIGWTPVECHP